MKAPRVARAAVAAMSVGAMAAIAGGCAAAKSPPAAPAAEAAGGRAARQDGYQAAADELAPSMAYGEPPPAATPLPVRPEGAKATTPAAGAPAPGPTPAPATPGAAPTGGSTRSFAIQSAARDVASAERELDVAASDCAGACRALGSMDRAAGRLCELSHGDGDNRRCEDARRRVYSARDRVKATCGGCANGPSVERSAPIPSLR